MTQTSYPSPTVSTTRMDRGSRNSPGPDPSRAKRLAHVARGRHLEHAVVSGVQHVPAGRGSRHATGVVNERKALVIGELQHEGYRLRFLDIRRSAIKTLIGSEG